MLEDPANAKIVADALRHFDGERYELASFVVMPNHVHVLFRPAGKNVLADTPDEPQVGIVLHSRNFEFQ